MMDHTKIDVGKVTKELRACTVDQLRRRYAEVFGEPTRVKHKDHLIKRILWRLQAMQEGDLSERARRRAKELAQDAEIRLYAPRPTASPPGTSPGTVITAPFELGRASGVPKPGSVLRREYKGGVVVVKVLPKGFEYDGEVYRSLTAIAQKVTGSHWNGVNFFGLTPNQHESKKHETQDAEVTA